MTGASSCASVTSAMCPPAVDVQPGVGEQPRHDPGVDHRDDRVVVPGDDQRRLPDQPQERQAAPAGAGGQLVVVAAPRAEPRVGVQRPRGPLGVGAHRAAVDLPGDAARVLGVAVPPRGEHPGQHARVRRHHERARCRSRRAPAAGTGARCWTAKCWASPPPQDSPRTSTGPSMPEPVQHAGDDRGEGGQDVGDDRPRRAAHARDVEPDHRPPRVQRVDERLQHLQARADAVHQQQRRHGTRPSPGRTETRSVRPAAVTVRTYVPRRRGNRLLVEDIGAGRVGRAPSSGPPSDVGAGHLLAGPRSPSQAM